MRERITVVTLSVTLSVCVSLFDFRVETYISSYILGDDLVELRP